MLRSLTAKKQKFLTLQDKAAIIAEVEKGRKKKDIAGEYGIARSSLSTILKGKDAILAALGNDMTTMWQWTTFFSAEGEL